MKPSIVISEPKWPEQVEVRKADVSGDYSNSRRYDWNWSTHRPNSVMRYSLSQVSRVKKYEELWFIIRKYLT